MAQGWVIPKGSRDLEGGSLWRRGVSPRERGVVRPSKGAPWERRGGLDTTGLGCRGMD